MSRHRHPRPRRWRSPHDVQPLERAFQTVLESAAGDPPPHATPLALCFSTTGHWSRWLRRVRERYPDLELPTTWPYDEHAAVQWSDWTLLDGLEPLLARYIDEEIEGVRARLEHVAALGLMEFRTDKKGARFFRVRTDEAARVAAWLDDEAEARRN